MSRGREGFLSRWSRLKREPEAPAAPAEAATTAPAEPKLPEGKTLDDLLAELPRIEDLVPGQSLTAFMQPWVPNGVRNAALQRMWLLDPAIRDYVSPALDYAYDYNTPGAAPGFGSIETSQDAIREVAEMFDRVLGKAGPEAPSDPPAAPQDNLSQSGREMSAAPVSGAAQQSAADGQTAAKPYVGDDGGDPGQPGVVRQKAAASDDAASQHNASELNALRPAGRRHGGALPG